MNDFEKCLKERRIVRITTSPDMVQKEIESAEYDLMRAEESIIREDNKWASVQAYYSMFHSAKALVLEKGYREKSHYCLIIALRELYVSSKEMEEEHVSNLEMAMDIRHEADYGLTYSSDSASITISAAQQMLEIAKDILRV